MMRFSTMLGLTALTTCLVSSLPAAEPTHTPPEGFTALFNGKDLSGWRGLGHANPYEIAKWSEADRKQKQAAADEDMNKHWRVENGEIVNDGHGVYLTTAKDYRDFELLIDWRMMTPQTDSGIYLRGTPQVQIWNPDGPDAKKLGADKGSGALWNNEDEKNGKWPSEKVDKPIGEWNSFRIRMVGERVTIHMNGKKIVDDATLENYWDRKRPVPVAGPIQLQTHGGEMRFRNVYIHEITAEEANKILAADEAGFTSLFNGKDFSGWIGDLDGHVVKDGVLAAKKGVGGTLFTKDIYADFDFRFEFKLTPGANNGIAIRSDMQGNPAYDAMEIQILDDSHPQYKDLHDWQVHGSIYGVVPAHRGYLRPVGEWNTERIVARGSQIQIYVNGTKIVDADVAKVKPIDGHDHPGRLRKDGHIGFFGHHDPLEFRNIRVKPLK